MVLFGNITAYSEIKYKTSKYTMKNKKQFKRAYNAK